MKKICLLLAWVFLILNVFAQKMDKTINSAKTANHGSVLKIKIENPLDSWRKDEVVDLQWDSLLKKNPQLLSDLFIIENESTREQYSYQIIKSEANKPVKLIFQVSIAPLATINILVKKGTPPVFKAKTFGSYVPERKDDFTWENDKIAFRMYGPALQATGEISSGIDVWLKRTPEMIIDKWYKLDDYHTDHGEGLDSYKVGPTLGAGGIAPFADGKLFYSKNWDSYKLIYTGALQTVFELKYKEWKFKETEITETKRITLNAGSQLNKVEILYQAKGLDTISIAVGIIKRKESGIAMMNEINGFIGYWEPADKKNGTTGIGIIVPNNRGMSVVENHFVAFSSALNNKPFTYFQGACWDKAGDIKNELEWFNYLNEFNEKVQNALIISY